MAGDFNQLSDKDIQDFGMLREKTDPTRGNNCLDRIYTSEPVYDKIIVVASAVKTDHKAIYATTKSDTNLSKVINSNPKVTEKVNFRSNKPSQCAQVLFYLKNNTEFFKITSAEDDFQLTFDQLYEKLNFLLNEFFPSMRITLSDRDPYFMTPRIKCLLRTRNRLMRKGCVDKAQSLSKRVGQLILSGNVSLFSETHPIRDSKDLWGRVNELKGKTTRPPHLISGISAEDLNAHYAAVSTDLLYEAPSRKITVYKHYNRITEEWIFRMLDSLKKTSPGKLQPLSEIYNRSLNSAQIPQQWKCSVITPVAKILRPVACSDFRPISVTPILS